MGDIESLSSNPHYWKSCLVIHLLIENFDRPAQPAQRRTFHQAVFFHSDLGGSTDGEHILLLLTHPTMLIHPSPYAEIPKQPWDHMLASVNPLTSVVPKIQLEKLDNPELGCMYQTLRCGHMSYSLKYTWAKGCGSLLFIITHHGAFDKLPSMSCLFYAMSLCFCRRSQRNLIKILIDSFFYHRCRGRRCSYPVIT